MKILLLFIFICVISPRVVCGDLSDVKRGQIKDLLKESAFNSWESFQRLELEKVKNNYHPLLVSVLASHNSKNPNKDEEDEWLQVELPPNKESVTCPNNIRAMFKKSKSDSVYTYVILTGAFTSLESGDYVNQISDVLNRKFSDPNIIAFSGIFHPDFLKDSCELIPWNTVSISKDVYLRINDFLKYIGADPEYNGIIGVSLGAYFTIMILGHDAELARQDEGSIVFGLGGIALSPPLHARTTYKNLDEKHKMRQINSSKGLTTFDFDNVINFFEHWLFLGRNEDIIDYFESSTNEFSDRVFNELTSIGLGNMISAIDFNKNLLRGEVSYYDIFINTGFVDHLTDNDSRRVLKKINYHPLYRRHRIRSDMTMNSSDQFPELTLSKSNINALYDRTLDTKPFLKSVDRPLLLYLSQDDSILFQQDTFGKPIEIITNILEEASQNENIVIFHPKYGGHLGILLDPIFDELIFGFFSP